MFPKQFSFLISKLFSNNVPRTQGQTANTRRQISPSSVNGHLAVQKFPPPFAEHKISLSCSQKPANGPYPLSWTNRLTVFLDVRGSMHHSTINKEKFNKM